MAGEGLGPLASLTRKGSIIDTARELIDRLEEEPTKVESSLTVLSVVTMSGAGPDLSGDNENKCLGIHHSGKILSVEY